MKKKELRTSSSFKPSSSSTASTSRTTNSTRSLPTSKGVSIISREGHSSRNNPQGVLKNLIVTNDDAKNRAQKRLDSMAVLEQEIADHGLPINCLISSKNSFVRFRRFLGTVTENERLYFKCCVLDCGESYEGKCKCCSVELCKEHMEDHHLATATGSDGKKICFKEVTL